MKIIKVKNCRECPYHIEVDYLNYYPVCMKKVDARVIPDIYKIPDWCPLEDYEEKKNDLERT